MKKIFYLILLVPAILLNSCSKGGSSDNTPPTYPINGVWQYNFNVVDGVDYIALGYNTFLYIWEDEGIWASEVYDINGYITSMSQLGYFSMAWNQETAVFTVEGYYDPYNQIWMYLNVPLALNATIDKLNNNELDFTIIYDGSLQMTRTDLTNLPLPNIGFNNENLQHRKNMLDKVKELKEKRNK